MAKKLDPWESIRKDVEKVVDKALKKIRAGVDIEDVRNSIEVPPAQKMGDLACSISFQVGKKREKSPREVAEKLLERIKKPASIKKIKLSGAYLNFQFDRGKFAKEIVKAAGRKKFGRGKKKKKFMVEYSQPNPLKAFHIGHVRGTVIGDSISRILDYSGYETIKANYYNDMGTHVARVLWDYMKNHKGETPGSDVGNWFAKLYSEASKKVENNPEVKEKVSETLKKLEKGEGEVYKTWKKLRDISIKEFDKIYEELDVQFDEIFYESEVAERGKEIVKELKKKKIAEKSEGAIIVDLEKYNLGTLLLVKSDGTMLYSVKDLALAEKKLKEFDVDKSIYVVGVEQRLYFQQLFKTLELMGLKKAEKCKHLAYELVNLASGKKISSREGTAILYKDLKEKMIDKAMEEILERNPELDPFMQKEIAKQISFGAMKFSMLNIGNNKTIFFDWDTALEFEGETGPYIQYAGVRAKRILEQIDKTPNLSKCNFKEILDEEHLLLKKIAKFPQILEDSAEQYRPYEIAHYVYEIAEKFNTFYNKCRVLDADEKGIKNMRLRIVSATFNTLKTCLYLLGIDIPERM
ncbi:MAG: arginine--tRNA ligase [Candidatus Undinarchaeales archaeon]